MPGVNFEKVREQVSLSDVLRLLDFEPTSVRGDQVRGRCPLHGTSEDGDRGRGHAFSANVRLGRYRCFKCGSRGHALELWCSARQISLFAGTIELCELLDVEVPWIERW